MSDVVYFSLENIITYKTNTEYKKIPLEFRRVLHHIHKSITENRLRYTLSPLKLISIQVNLYLNNIYLNYIFLTTSIRVVLDLLYPLSHPYLFLVQKPLVINKDITKNYFLQESISRYISDKMILFDFILEGKELETLRYFYFTWTQTSNLDIIEDLIEILFSWKHNIDTCD